MGEKMREKMWEYHFRKISPHILAFFFFSFFFFFLLAFVCFIFSFSSLSFFLLPSSMQPYIAFVSFTLDKIVPLATISLLPRYLFIIYIYIYICFGFFLSFYFPSFVLAFYTFLKNEVPSKHSCLKIIICFFNLIGVFE